MHDSRPWDWIISKPGASCVSAVSSSRSEASALNAVANIGCAIIRTAVAGPEFAVSVRSTRSARLSESRPVTSPPGTSSGRGHRPSAVTSATRATTAIGGSSVRPQAITSSTVAWTCTRCVALARMLPCICAAWLPNESTVPGQRSERDPAALSSKRSFKMPTPRKSDGAKSDSRQVLMPQAIIRVTHYGASLGHRRRRRQPPLGGPKADWDVNNTKPWRLRISTSISSTRFWAAQLDELLALDAAQALALALIDVGLRQPTAQAPLGDAEVLGHLRDRLLPQPRVLDGSTTKLRAPGCRYGLLSGDHHRSSRRPGSRGHSRHRRVMPVTDAARPT